MSHTPPTVIGAVDMEGMMGRVAEQDVEQAEERSPVERAVIEGRDPGWEELLELADRVGPSAALVALDDRALEEQEMPEMVRDFLKTRFREVANHMRNQVEEEAP